MSNSTLIKLDEQIRQLRSNPIVVEMQKFGECHLFGGYIRSVLRGETPKDTDIFVIVPEITDTLLNDASKQLQTIEHISVYNPTIKIGNYTDSRNQMHRIEVYDTDDNHFTDDQHILTRRYDILFATSIPSYIDFDVNSICVKIAGVDDDGYTSTLSSLVIAGNSFQRLTVDQIISNIVAGKFNIMQSASSIGALSPTELYLFIRRIGLRIDDHYELMPTPHNINVVLLVISKYNGFEHVRSGIRRTITITIAHLIMFVKTVGTFTDIEKLIVILRNSKQIFTSTLNYNITCNQTSAYVTACAKLCSKLHSDIVTL